MLIKIEVGKSEGKRALFSWGVVGKILKQIFKKNMVSKLAADNAGNHASHRAKIDIRLEDFSQCFIEIRIVFNDIDELLSVLKTLDFSVYKQDVIEKLAFLKEETVKLFKMMQANDVELLLDVKGVFRKLEEHAKSANYSVKIQDG